MPRRIDRDAREREIADAALVVLQREGLAAMTVRAVAAEAGLAVASLRRIFSTQDELRRYCLSLIRQRAAERIAAVETGGIEGVLVMLEQLLPLDAERRTELLAQLQLGILAVTDPVLRDDAAALHADVRAVCAASLRALDGVPHGGAADADSAEGARIDTLHAFLDGLALHALVAAQQMTAAHSRLLLRTHLVSLRR